MNLSQPARIALFMLRVAWAALLLGQLAFAAAIPLIWRVAKITADRATIDLLAYLAVAGALLATVVGLFARNQIYKRGWRGDAVTPTAYFTGNLILFALLEGASSVGLVACLLHGSFWPTVLPSAWCIVLQVINIPTGRPMQGDDFAALRDMTQP